MNATFSRCQQTCVRINGRAALDVAPNWSAVRTLPGKGRLPLHLPPRKGGS
jgi:hypothetical protein